MRCPQCGQDKDRVLDSRAIETGGAIRRRRECLECKTRFTTHERAEEHPVTVVKRDGTPVPFDADRVRGGIVKACKKRPVTMEQIDAIVGRVLMRAKKADGNVTTQQIGSFVMDELMILDEVAYVRFASVYRAFQSSRDFIELLGGIGTDAPHKTAKPEKSGKSGRSEKG
jgi:transcriptional repressor NrdR